MLTSQADLVTEGLLSVTELRAMIPSSRPGRRVNKSTIFRWITHGCHGVRLEAEKIGGTFYTSLPAFRRFRAALNQRQTPFEPSEQPDRTAKAESAQAPSHAGHLAAMRQLEASGI